MSERLPREIDPLRLADEGVRLEGRIPGETFPRLRELSAPGSTPEDATVVLEFERTTHGVRLLHGTLRTRLTVICQRCLEPMSLELEAHPYLELRGPGEPATGTEEAEALEVEGPMHLSEWAEDELLLVMPMIPVHDERECSTPETGMSHDAATEGKANPFSSLRGFRQKR